MSMFKKIKKRSKEDKGNAVIILGIMLIMALLLVGGLLLDVSKAYQLKSSYIDAARKATQAAVMEQRPDGYLRAEAAAAAILTYENITRPTVVNKDGYFSECEDYGENDVSLRIIFSKEGSGTSSLTVPRRNVSEYDTVASLTQKLGLAHGMNRDMVNNSRYTSIQLEVTEGTENVILPGTFSISQADEEDAANMKCQQMEIGAKANIFTGDEHGSFD